METKSFFGPVGLTSTSANHYANLAKETARGIHNYLDNVKFYTTKISVIGQEDATISNGMLPEKLSTIPDGLKLISGLNSLIAFLREAIKEKDRLATEASEWEDKEVHSEFDARYSALLGRRPVRAEYITKEDIIKSWSIGEQEKYLSLEAEAATLGKYIHEDGCISKARINLMTVTSSPVSVKENGRDTIIYRYTPTVTKEEVDDMFFHLQARHREVQAELNGMKKRIDDALDSNKLEVDEAYRLAYQSWSAEKNAMDRELQQICEEDSKKRKQLALEVQNLKIAVPNRLKDIFDSLQSL